MVILENLIAKSFKMTHPRKFCTSKSSQYTVTDFGNLQACTDMHAEYVHTYMYSCYKQLTVHVYIRN